VRCKKFHVFIEDCNAGVVQLIAGCLFQTAVNVGRSNKYLAVKKKWCQQKHFKLKLRPKAQWIWTLNSL